MSGLKGRVEGIEERISKLEKKTIGIMQLKEKKKKILKILNRASKIYETITKDSKSMSLQSRKKGEKRARLKNYSNK